MQARLDWYKISGGAYRAMAGLEEFVVSLTIAIVAINGWNRLRIAFRTVPGAYQPARAGKA